jgi:hypothetical protein
VPQADAALEVTDRELDRGVACFRPSAEFVIRPCWSRTVALATRRRGVIADATCMMRVGGPAWHQAAQ